MTTIRRWASKLRRTGIDWFHYNIYFSKAALFISGLVFSHSLVEHAVVSVLISYFTKKWKKEHLPKLVAIVNVHHGVSAIMVMVIAYISDAYIGRFKTILFSTAAYIIGLVLLWLSAWLLTRNTEVRIFYVVVVLVALGKAGQEPPLKAFLADQLCEQDQNPDIDEDRVGARTKVWWRFAWFLGAAIAVVPLTNSNWRDIFMISAVVMGVAYLLFWSGIAFYYYKKPTGSPLSSVFSVFKAAIWKRHLDYPDTASQFFKNDSNKLLLLPHIPFFRWLDKAAIVESSTLSPEEQEKKGKLCTVTQVKEVKSLLEMVPMWTTFFVYSLVEATGRTFFIEQSNVYNLNARIGNHFSASFIVLKSFSSFIISSLYELLIPKRWSEAKQRHATLVRIGVGMACSVLCCIAAWLVEVHRWNIIKREGLLDEASHKTIATSILWLVPQFSLLGLMEGLAKDGLNDFFYDQVAKSMASYGPPFNDCVLGIGKFFTILCVFVLRSWFGDTINNSHLDKYYRTLALLSLGNLCFYWFVSTFYAHKKAQGVEVELDAILVDGVTVSVAKFLSTETKSYSRSMTWPFRSNPIPLQSMFP